MPKPVILLAHPILEPSVPLFSEAYQVERLWEHDWSSLHEGIGRQVEAIVEAGEQPLPPELLLGLPKLRLIACVSVGYDGVDVPWCRAHGIEVTHAHWLNADDVADHAMGMVLASWRGLLQGNAHILSGRWQAGERLRPFGSLMGKTIGIVGLGHIGAAVARRAEPCGLTIAWWGPRPKDVPWRRCDTVLELAEASDILVIACRSDESTRGLVTREVIDALGKRGLLVNVARGQVVDEEALIEALKERRLGMAALDVFWQEPTPAERWADVPNIILTPHSAGASAETVVKMVGQTAENLRRHFAGEPLLSPVVTE
jgi:lactate dehydrogenase-like 2-hydroxyacid dehydrogenase